MLRENIRKIFGSKTFYIIFSILASLTLWLYIHYNEAPDMTTFVQGIPVEFLNTDLLEDKSLILTYKRVETLNIRFIGKRSVVSTLNNKNITVTVDMATVFEAKDYNMPYTIAYPSGLSDADRRAISVDSTSVDYIRVTVENYRKKTVPVYGVYSGGTPEGFMSDALSFSPDTITVNGPEAFISKVERAWVDIPRRNLAKTIIEDFEFVLQDKDGNDITTPYLKLSQNTVTVTVPILMKKETPLQVSLLHGAGSTDANTKVVITPASITLSGDASILSGYNSIPLGVIDLTKFDASTTETFLITLPNDVTNETGVTEATVKVLIHGLATKTLTTDNIQFDNVPDGLHVELITGTVSVKVRGSPSDIDKMLPTNIRVVADLAGLGVGTYSVVAKIVIDGAYADIGAVGGDYKVTFTISNGQTDGG